VEPIEIVVDYDGAYTAETIRTLQTMDHEQINNDLIVDLIRTIVNRNSNNAGAILVFLPGQLHLPTLLMTFECGVVVQVCKKLPD
jgi:hypothetical protein